MRSILTLLLLTTLAGPAMGASLSGDYSSTNNPAGDWAYGRKFSPTATQFDVAPARYPVPAELESWWFSNPGHGAPGIADFGSPGPSLWSKDNSNGQAVVRWTAPTSGVYNVVGLFEVNDSRGANNAVYVAVNNVVEFSNVVVAYLDTAPFSLPSVSLEAGDTVDFVLAYNGGDPEIGWTRVDADILDKSATVPSMAPLGLALLGGLLGLAGWRRLHE